MAARQQTLAASIDWSHDLLDADERQVFRRLAVFAGGFTLDAAEAVCGTAVDTLARLVDKSLVVAAGGRYRLLETIREYAVLRLADSGEQVRDLHLGYFLAAAEAAEPLLDSDRDAWRAAIEPDRENYRAALDYGLSNDPGRGRRLAAALAWMWNLRATGPEGIGYLRLAIDAAPDERSLLQARLLFGYATIADTVDPFGYDAAGRGLELATELGDDRLRSLFLALVAVGKFFTDFQEAWELAEEGRRLAEGIGDEVARDANLALQCVLLALWDRHDELPPLTEVVIPGLLARGERGVATTVLLVQSESLAVTGDLPQAVEVAKHALATAEPLADFHRVGTARGQLATLLARSGRLDEAYELMRPLLDLADAAVVPNLGQVMGLLSYRSGDPDTAVEWMRREVDPDGPLAETYVPAMLLPTYAAALQDPADSSRTCGDTRPSLQPAQGPRGRAGPTGPILDRRAAGQGGGPPARGVDHQGGPRAADLPRRQPGIPCPCWRITPTAPPTRPAWRPRQPPRATRWVTRLHLTSRPCRAPMSHR